jgi:hypothetical protein
MTKPIFTNAGPFPASLVGIHFDRFLEQIGVQVAPHPLPTQTYIHEHVFERQKPGLLAGLSGVQPLVDRARQLFSAVDNVNTSAQLDPATTNIVVATLGHQAALYAYLAAGWNYRMYRLYAQLHEMFADMSSHENVRRDHVYRAIWGFSHYAQRFQDREQTWKGPWSDLLRVLQRALAIAHPDHADAISRYLDIARAGPPADPLTLEEVLKTLNPGAGESFRGVFMTELKRFLGTKLKEFPPEQQLTFTPFELADDGSRALMTRLSIQDSSGGHNSYPLAIQVSHLGGFSEDDGGEVGTTVVSIRDGSGSLAI